MREAEWERERERWGEENSEIKSDVARTEKRRKRERVEEETPSGYHRNAFFPSIGDQSRFD